MKIFCLFVVALTHVSSFVPHVTLRMSSTPFDILGSGLKSLKEVTTSNTLVGKAPAQSKLYYEHPVRVQSMIQCSNRTCHLIHYYNCDLFSFKIGLVDASILTGFLWNEDTTGIYSLFDIRSRSYLW